MTPLEHYAEAERLLAGPHEDAPDWDDARRDNLAAAQVHATLAVFNPANVPPVARFGTTYNKDLVTKLKADRRAAELLMSLVSRAPSTSSARHLAVDRLIARTHWAGGFVAAAALRAAQNQNDVELLASVDQAIERLGLVAR